MRKLNVAAECVKMAAQVVLGNTNPRAVDEALRELDRDDLVGLRDRLDTALRSKLDAEPAETPRPLTEAGCCRRTLERCARLADDVADGVAEHVSGGHEAGRRIAQAIRALPLPEQKASESETNELLARFATEHDACKDALEPFVDRWAGRPLLDMVRDAVALLSAPESEGT